MLSASDSALSLSRTENFISDRFIFIKFAQRTIKMENKPENEDADVVQPKTSADIKNNDEDNISSDSNDDSLDDNQLMSHQEAMEQFKDALAELIVVSRNCLNSAEDTVTGISFCTLFNK